ncbi:MAG: DNA polymerase III subunit delta' [Chthoniobacterales bacterium]|nr:DNA polymerase III subunit delta' [Chthoniobacterales bacterium]
MLTLNDIFGQDIAIDMLRRAFAADRLPHAMLFAGPRGVGKASTARALAAVFLCVKPSQQDALPCGKCESCRVMTADNHPDFHVVYRQLIRLDKESSKARDLSIDVVRVYVVHPASLKPVMGNGKVIVVEEAELMNPQAQNAMLKTLEEPIGRALIILLTDAPGLLLPTILSRCQIVRFASLDEQLVERELAKQGVAKTDAAEAAMFSEGSLGLASRWLADGIVERARELVDRIDTLLARKPLGGDLDAWFKKSAELYAEAELKRDDLASKDQATREGLSLYLKLAANHLRRKLVDLTDSEQMERCCAAIDALVRAEANVDGNVNVPLTFQQLTVALERELVGR